MTYIKTHHEKGHSIRNQAGTADRSCHCGTWLDHWKTYTKSPGDAKCAVEGCEQDAEVGAHVELNLVSDFKGKSFIAPMCLEHNGKHGGEFRTKPGHLLAVGNVADTCGKPPLRTVSGPAA